jgi:bidirectional [NiFe] hydrogenase diaphorase subunit
VKPRVAQAAELGPVGGAPPAAEEPWAKVEAKMREIGYRADGLIEVLHTAQQAFGYLPESVLEYLADKLKVPPSKVFGVATFYSYFSLKPRKRHTVVVCTGTACYLSGAGALVSMLADALKPRHGDDRRAARVSVLEARCLGPCSMAPVLVVDGEVRGRVHPAELAALVEAM